MWTKEFEAGFNERAGRLEAQMDWVKSGFEEIKHEMREMRQEMREIRTHMDARFDAMDIRFNERFDRINTRFDSWLKWVVGLIFSTWITVIISIWLKQ